MAKWWERFFDEAYLRLWAETIRGDFQLAPFSKDTGRLIVLSEKGAE